MPKFAVTLVAIGGACVAVFVTTTDAAVAAGHRTALYAP